MGVEEVILGKPDEKVSLAYSTVSYDEKFDEIVVALLSFHV